MEVKIQIPDNCELIKDGDTYIVKEKKNDKPRSWEEFCEKYPLHENEVYLDSRGNVNLNFTLSGKKRYTPNWIINKQEAEAFLALMQLRQLRKAWIGDWEQPIDDATVGYITYSIKKKQVIVDYGWTWRNSILSFPTRIMAYDFLGCFRDLCETAKTLL